MSNNNAILNSKYYMLNDSWIAEEFPYPVILDKGSILKLAGVKLSTMTKNSPFHYKNEIIRIPNDWVSECKSQYIENQSIQSVVIYPTVDTENINKNSYDIPLRREILLWLFTIGIWVWVFLLFWSINFQHSK